MMMMFSREAKPKTLNQIYVAYVVDVNSDSENLSLKISIRHTQ